MRARRLPLIACTVALIVVGATHRAFSQSAAVANASLRLPRLFADGMVVQRDKPIVVWGWSAPGASVAIAFHGRSTSAVANANGQWQARLPAEHAGGPFELSVRAGAERAMVHDVLVGDVWVASGQSNMEFRVAEGNDAAHEIASAHDTLLRQFKVPNSWSKTPETDLAGGTWMRADSQHVGGFSAVAYFFARELRHSVGVPIGIINTTWGGSNIETWISRDAQHLSDNAWSAVLEREDAFLRSIRDSLTARLGALPTSDSGLVDGRAVWADSAVDETRWHDIPVPAYWEPNGYPGMDGIAWYRLAFDLTESDIARGVTLRALAIDDDDITWVNGVEIGQTVGYNVRRSYPIPASALHAGRNLLAVRVTDGGGGGGINGAISLSFGDGSERSLAGTWKFRVGAVSFQPDGQRINKIPSVLYNAMIRPLLPFSIKGVIWYQGESNANNDAQAAAYREQFQTLIASWRSSWNGGRDTFPFLWVQLPNFGAPDSVPPLHAAWATQRESMDAALTLPSTGRAIAIDVGEANDIHPRNKQDVGLRLARVAEKAVYHQPAIASGPTYASHAIRGDSVIVRFSSVGGGLVTKAGGSRVGGFELAGADKRFVWADAEIVGNTVKVWSSQVVKPVAVRYGWSNNPDRANLYNAERMPAAPFRSDRW
jgi:sialate O-acetylesterase